MSCKIHNLSNSYSYKKFKCRCDDCLEWKRSTRSGENRELARIRSKEWRKANPERSRYNAKRYQRKNPQKVLEWQLRKYGLTLDKHKQLLCKQKGRCAICGSNSRGMQHSNNRLCIDHDKDTGKVRGLLCGGCNVGLGHFQHSIEFLRRAIEYLEGYE